MNTCNPEKCLDKCPVAKLITQHIDRHNVDVDDAISRSVSDLPDVVASAISESAQMFGLPGDGIAPTQIADKLRKQDGEIVEGLTAHIADLEAKRGQLTETCAGPLGMRAMRGGIEYTITVCTSPVMPKVASSEPAHVVRRDI